MGDRLKEIRERQRKRRELLAQQLGAADADSLGQVLKSKVELEEQAKAAPAPKPTEEPPEAKRRATELSVEREERKDTEWQGEGDEDEYFELVEEVYQDSSTFLKGTQSANPHNDYCQHFVDTGQRPQNFIRDVGLADRFEEYPKLKELIKLKDELIAKTACPPMFLQCDLETFDMRELDYKFDVILVEPPLEEYQREGALYSGKFWAWEEVMKLEIEEVAAQRSFMFLWCGSGDGLDWGRKCLRKWGFRRCEDICWIKTNINNPGVKKNLEPKGIFQRTKEHCLMGIKGTVRRSTDGDFIHANVDIDLIISEEPAHGSIEKPDEIFSIMEHFCLGRRRLHVFGRDDTIRPGWLSIGPALTNTNFAAETYKAFFNKGPNDFLTGCTEKIEALRPKSPTPKIKGEGRGGRGGGRGGSSRGGQGGWQGRGGGGRGGFGGRGRGRGMHRGGYNPR